MDARRQFGADGDGNPEILDRADLVTLNTLADRVGDALIVAGPYLGVVAVLAAWQSAVLSRLLDGSPGLRRDRPLCIGGRPLLIVLLWSRLGRTGCTRPTLRPLRLGSFRRLRRTILGLRLIRRSAAVAIILSLALCLIALQLLVSPLLLLSARARSLIGPLALSLVPIASLGRAALRVLAWLDVAALNGRRFRALCRGPIWIKRAPRGFARWTLHPDWPIPRGHDDWLCPCDPSVGHDRNGGDASKLFHGILPELRRRHLEEKVEACPC
ncbi:hypothetical protein BLM15_29030 (plasmid) [Bosea sp. Tri-49]|nr:hypothetical protein BLM15_29030 [Bosea sp. Tri-49]